MGRENRKNLKERKKVFTTQSGIPLERLYTPEDLKGIEYDLKIGYPGEYPFTRGVQPTMYRGRLWTMRQYAGFGTAEETNKRFKYLLEQGQTGLSVAFDLPTQMGYDSDHPISKGEVGRVGVAIDSLEDMETLFDGIPLGEVSTSMTINATASMLLAMYMVTSEKQGISSDRIQGTVQNDLLKEFIARGTYIFPPGPSVKITIDVLEFCRDAIPRWNPISVSGYHIREAGSTAVQELAFMLANAIEYLENAKSRGLDVEKIAERVSFFFAVHNNFLEEIAKYRAARRLWAKIMRERFNAKGDRACLFRVHSQTSGVTLMAQQPRNNIMRVTLQALAAVLAGTQSLHTNSYDEALALPSEEAATIALRTQQLVAYESGAADTVDPLGGSYVIESLTNKIEDEVVNYLRKIDKSGGMIKCIQDGYINHEIEEASYRYQLEIEKKERIIVGVNEFTTGNEESIETHRINPKIEEIKRAKLIELRNKRDNDRVKADLKKLEETARDNGNLMPYIVEAVRDYATIGEMTLALERVYNRHRQGSVSAKS
ncbi:methylmalonyl-CoA mutase family protein [Desulfobacterota bacterium AH_259_B03_O07]|nr:methylmalonyl-CoA mutase family protein [Desulfobacterota bacterium AH_259_B03_O07]